MPIASAETPHRKDAPRANRGRSPPVSGDAILSPFMDLPESLKRKIELWRAKARSFRDEAELFPTTSWVAVMLGQGIEPESYDPIADALDENKVAGALDQIRQAIRQTAERLPSHGEFIAHISGQRPAHPELPEFVF